VIERAPIAISRRSRTQRSRKPRQVQAGVVDFATLLLLQGEARDLDCIRSNLKSMTKT